MLSATNSRVTAACAVAMMMMMMMMMTGAAAMPKAAKPHRQSSDGAAVETVPLQLDPNSLVPTRNMRPLENASISPWAYNVSSDDSMFPPVLSEARCLLRGCLNSKGQEDLNLESRPIMHQVLMLRRVRSVGAGHGYHYRLESRLVAVGCTCVRPRVQLQQ
ncbi:interleukin 17a/f1 [Parambassis ranga]|uniref:Interleukin 17a/f1 n=1 Tax=Parambassis ranga TaxID=210632 RepID=A0A6P7IAC8_9TELE|nr:interleukin-17F-like [Parambassis ranga]